MCKYVVMIFYIEQIMNENKLNAVILQAVQGYQ